MNLEVPRAILSLGCVFLSTGAKTVWGFFQPPFGELGLTRQTSACTTIRDDRHIWTDLNSHTGIDRH